MMETQLRLLGCVLVLAAAPAWAQPITPSDADRDRASALEAYADGHWTAAFEQLATLADRGDAESARIAVLMVRHGASLYRTAFTTDPSRVAAWKGQLRRPLISAEAADNGSKQDADGAPQWTSR